MKSENNTSDTAENRAAKIDALAQSIIDDAKERELEKRRLADEGMEKIRRHFANIKEKGDTMNPMNQVYRQAFADVLFEMAQKCLCRKCSTFLEGAALSRYKLLMAKRREEIASLQTKVEKQKSIENRKRDLEMNNKKNRPTGTDNE